MLILKRTAGSGVIFDTDNPEKITPTNDSPGVPLHQCHHTTDYAFLSQYFREDHPIFILFGKSFYYVAEQQETVSNSIDNLQNTHTND